MAWQLPQDVKVNEYIANYVDVSATKQINVKSIADSQVIMTANGVTRPPYAMPQVETELDINLAYKDFTKIK